MVEHNCVQLKMFEEFDVKFVLSTKIKHYKITKTALHILLFYAMSVLILQICCCSGAAKAR